MIWLTFYDPVVLTMVYLLIALFLIIAGYIFAAILRERYKPFREVNTTLYFASYWALAFMLVAATLCWQSATTNPPGTGDFDLSVFTRAPDWSVFTRFFLSGVCGAICGVVLGIFFFPQNAQEQTQFQQIRSVVGALLAGIVGSQFLDFFRYVTKIDGTTRPKLLEPKFAIATGMFMASLGFGIVIVYAYRNLTGSGVRITSIPNQQGFFQDSDGVYSVTSSGDLRLRAGSSVRFAGAAMTAGNVGVHWRVEPADSSNAVKDELVEVDASGLVKTADASDANWKSLLPVKVRLFASSDANPTLSAMIGIQIEAAKSADS